MSAGARGVPFDAYAVLGVSPSATSDEIHHAYRMLARRIHPDADRTDPLAAARFAQITEAYDLLVDGDRRRSYDLGRAAVAGPRAARVAPGPTGNTAVRGPAARPPVRRREPAVASRPRREDTHDEFRLLVFLAKVVIGVVIVIVLAALLLAFHPPPPCRADTPINAPCTPTATPP